MADHLRCFQTQLESNKIGQTNSGVRSLTVDEKHPVTGAQPSTFDEGKTIVQGSDAHQLAVEALIAKLDAIQDEIPHFTLPDSKSATRKLNPLASVPAEFITLML